MTTGRTRSRPTAHSLRIITSSIFAGLAAAGCQKPQNTISQVEPYAGKRPEPIVQLPQPEEPPPVQPSHRHPAGGPAGWVPSGGIANKWECIVVHHSALDKSTPEGMAAWHKQRGWDALGYHFVIGNGIGYPDGEVFVGERWSKQMTGAHCKVPGNFYNEHGVGICLIGNLDAHSPTKRQMQSLAKLVSFLTSRCGIPTSKVYTHGGITHKTACPGRYFNLASLQRQLSAVSIGEDSPEE